MISTNIIMLNNTFPVFHFPIVRISYFLRVHAFKNTILKGVIRESVLNVGRDVSYDVGHGEVGTVGRRELKQEAVKVARTSQVHYRVRVRRPGAHITVLIRVESVVDLNGEFQTLTLLVVGFASVVAFDAVHEAAEVLFIFPEDEFLNICDLELRPCVFTDLEGRGHLTGKDFSSALFPVSGC